MAPWSGARSRVRVGKLLKMVWRLCFEAAFCGGARGCAARHRSEALSPPPSIPCLAAWWRVQQGPGAGVGAEPLLLSGDDPDQGREPDRALRGRERAARVALAPARS